MDAAAHDRPPRSLGRDELLAAAAPAVLVRHRAADDAAADPTRTGAPSLPPEPRRDPALPPGATIRRGDVILTLHRSADLFDLLGDDHDRR
jgi:hypothetical protein